MKPVINSTISPAIKVSFAPVAKVAFICALSAAPLGIVNASLPVAVEAVQGNEKTVKGQVLDNNNEPLIGATILVKGTQKGTVTDFDGNFEIKTTQGSTLIISFIGMQTQEIKVTDANHYQIKL